MVAASVAGERRFRAKMSVVTKFAFRLLWRRVRGTYHRFGYAAVSFGRPMSLAQYLAKDDDTSVEHLAQTLMQQIAQEVPVLPVPLVATVLMRHDKSVSRSDLEAEIAELIDLLPKAHVHLPREDMQYAIDVGLRALAERGIIVIETDQISVKPEETKKVEILTRLRNAAMPAMGKLQSFLK